MRKVTKTSAKNKFGVDLENDLDITGTQLSLPTVLLTNVTVTEVVHNSGTAYEAGSSSSRETLKTGHWGTVDDRRKRTSTTHRDCGEYMKG